MSELDAHLMGIALEVGRRGRTAPNPHVGAVIARGETVLGTGFHERAGEPHAEIAALRKVGEGARGATLYCTLEPCNHQGRTPPCVDAILAAGIERVVVGCADPAKHGAEAGISRLRSHGVEVVVGVRREECEELIEDFACLVRHGRPLVTLKAAVTLDGRIATRTGDSKWITGEEARAHAHRARSQADAIMVGVGTILSDDPQLNVRLSEGPHPLRVILDAHLRTPPGAKALAEPGGPTWIVHGPDAPVRLRDWLASAGVTLIEVGAKGASLDLSSALAELGRRHVMRVIVEGGARVHGAMLEAELVDRAAVYVAPRMFADVEAMPLARTDLGARTVAAALRLEAVRHTVLGGDVLFEGRLMRGQS